MSTPTQSQTDQGLDGARSAEGPSRAGGGHMEPSQSQSKDGGWLKSVTGRLEGWAGDMVAGTVVLTEHEWREHGRDNWLVQAKVESAVTAMVVAAHEKWGPPGR